MSLAHAIEFAWLMGVLGFVAGTMWANRPREPYNDYPRDP